MVIWTKGINILFEKTIQFQHLKSNQSYEYTAIPNREVQGLQGNPCNENRDPAMKTGVPCNKYRFFPVGIDLQGFPVSFTGFGFAVSLSRISSC